MAFAHSYTPEVKVYSHGQYSGTYHHWAKWEAGKSIAQFSRLAQSDSLYQKGDLPPRVELITIRVAEDNTLTISILDAEVAEWWKKAASKYHIQRDGDEKVVGMADFLCLSHDRTDPSTDGDALVPLKEFMGKIATFQVERLETPEFAILTNIKRILTYELVTFTLVLRLESEEQSRIGIILYLCGHTNLAYWAYGNIFQVMTTEGRDRVLVSVVYELHGSKQTRLFHVSSRVQDLNDSGVYVCKEGKGDAGYVLKLPQEGRPQSFYHSS
ncbi:hypothetical protein CLCR_10688 [Cladophialophora carrionii]|uniref:Uncharacterized protein n=1 Tax=Cladophialophora carrionii TaxID=86049 RepID=A0A1C1CW43_9EURO|nr:hypothetical protein CLCR_10688 [Cladophialophora carrionii]